MSQHPWWRAARRSSRSPGPAARGAGVCRHAPGPPRPPTSPPPRCHHRWPWSSGVLPGFGALFLVKKGKLIYRKTEKKNWENMKHLVTVPCFDECLIQNLQGNRRFMKGLSPIVWGCSCRFSQKPILGYEGWDDGSCFCWR